MNCKEKDTKVTYMCAQSCLTLQPRLLCPQDFPGKMWVSQATGVGCHFLLHGIFPTQGSNPHFLCLLHYRWILHYWAIRAAWNWAPDWELLVVNSVRSFLENADGSGASLKGKLLPWTHKKEKHKHLLPYSYHPLHGGWILNGKSWTKNTESDHPLNMYLK